MINNKDTKDTILNNIKNINKSLLNIKIIIINKILGYIFNNQSYIVFIMIFLYFNYSFICDLISIYTAIYFCNINENMFSIDLIENILSYILNIYFYIKSFLQINKYSFFIHF